MATKESPLNSLNILEHRELLRSAIAAGADVNARDKDGWAPLHHALRPFAVTALVAAGADIDARNNMQNTPLDIASRFGFTDAAMALIRCGADVNVHDKWGDTPLHNAMNPVIAVALMEAGANPQAKNSEGKTALEKLELHGSPAVVAAIREVRSREVQRDRLDTHLNQSQESDTPSL